MAMTQRSALGLDKLYYGLVTKDDTTGFTVGTIYPLPGAKTLSYNRAASLATNFADDKAFEQMETTGEKGITLSIVDLLPEDEARILGRTYLNGAIQEGSADASPDICIMGRTKLNGGKYGYFVYYKVKFGKPNSEDATQEASPAPRTVTMEGRVSDLIYNGLSREKVRDDDPSVPASRITNWFTNPTFASADLGSVTVAAAAGTAGQVVFTFTKAGGNTVLDQTTFIDPNIVVFLNSTGAKQSLTWAFGTSGGATQTATASGCTAGASSWYVSGSVKDSNGVGCTPKGGTVTVS